MHPTSSYKTLRGVSSAALLLALAAPFTARAQDGAQFTLAQTRSYIADRLVDDTDGWVVVRPSDVRKIERSAPSPAIAAGAFKDDDCVLWLEQDGGWAYFFYRIDLRNLGEVSASDGSQLLVLQHRFGSKTIIKMTVAKASDGSYTTDLDAGVYIEMPDVTQKGRTARAIRHAAALCGAPAEKDPFDSTSGEKPGSRRRD